MLQRGSVESVQWGVTKTSDKRMKYCLKYKLSRSLRNIISHQMNLKSKFFIGIKKIPERCFPHPANVKRRSVGTILRDCIYSKRNKPFYIQKEQSFKAKKIICVFWGIQGILIRAQNASYSRGVVYYSKLTGSWSFHSVLFVYRLSVAK